MLTPYSSTMNCIRWYYGNQRICFMFGVFTCFWVIISISLQCSMSPIQRMINSTKLKKNYDANVRILLSAEHVTLPEHNRLKKYRDMQGWKYTKYESITKTMALLNNSRYLYDDTAKDNATCIRCAVVGNGGILNGSKMGKEIDSHDYVFRTNAAITKGYEEDVGNRTSFYCFGMVTLSNSIHMMKNKGFASPPWNPNIRYVFFAENDWPYEYLYAALTNRTLPKGKRFPTRDVIVFPKPLVAEDMKIVHPDFLPYVEQSWMRSKKKIGRATTGTIMLFLALHTCDEVDVYGFGHTSDTTKFTYHYYDEKFTSASKITKVKWHDWQQESKAIKLLVDEGVFHMYTRS